MEKEKEKMIVKNYLFIRYEKTIRLEIIQKRNRVITISL